MADTRLVGNYKILETLGKGGYSWVKKGVDAKSKNFVALKFMARAEDAWAADQAEQVRTEIKSLTQVKHENVMKLYAYNLNAKYPEKTGSMISTILLVLEYCPGGELFDILYYTDKLDDKTGRTYFQMMIKGLEACHAAGITHRDIKPQNLLLDKNYQLKLTDFGLSKINDDPNSTMSTSYVGTRGYQAPELLAGKNYNKLCDVFSAGVVLFILLTGYPPFEQGDKRDKWYRPLAKGNSLKFWQQHEGCGISDDCKSLLEGMLAYKPKQRFTLEKIKTHKWYNGPVHSKKDLKTKLRERHRACMDRRKKDANKQREMVHSVKRDIPGEYADIAVKPELAEPGMFNVVPITTKNPFHALWRAKELLENKNCTVKWDSKAPLKFEAFWGDTDECKYTLRAHVRTDASGEIGNYLEFKRVKNEGVNSAAKFRKTLQSFMTFIMADRVFNVGFDKDGKAIKAAPEESKEADEEIKMDA